MSQYLKEELKNKILEETKNLILDNGYNNFSMRLLANKLDMSVGNLYRYFKCKEELLNFIVEPCINKLDDIISHTSNFVFSLQNSPQKIDYTKQDYKKILKDIIDGIYVLSLEFPKEFYILLLDKNDFFKLESWLNKIIHNILLKEYKNLNNLDVYSKISTSMIFEIFRKAFILKQNNDFDIKELLNNYINFLLQDLG